MPIRKELSVILKQKLAGKLPGKEAQLKMAPRVGETIYRAMEVSPSARRSAVLLPIYINPSDSLPELLFTLRSNRVESHKGQISFPGGMSENGEDVVATAVREANEEIGINTEDIDIIGCLTDLYVAPSDSVITPVAAIIANKNNFVINHDEVEEVFFINIEQFFDDKLKQNGIWKLGKNEVEVPFWEVHPTTPLWGATAMILSEFLEIYTEVINEIN